MTTTQLAEPSLPKSLASIFGDQDYSTEPQAPRPIIGEKRKAHFRWLERSVCKSKISFRSKAEARNFEIDRENRIPKGKLGGKCMPYECPVCGRWHLRKIENKTA